MPRKSEGVKDAQGRWLELPYLPSMLGINRDDSLMNNESPPRNDQRTLADMISELNKGPSDQGPSGPRNNNSNVLDGGHTTDPPRRQADRHLLSLLDRHPRPNQGIVGIRGIHSSNPALRTRDRLYSNTTLVDSGDTPSPNIRFGLLGPTVAPSVVFRPRNLPHRGRTNSMSSDTTLVDSGDVPPARGRPTEVLLQAYGNGMSIPNQAPSTTVFTQPLTRSCNEESPIPAPNLPPNSITNPATSDTEPRAPGEQVIYELLGYREYLASSGMSEDEIEVVILMERAGSNQHDVDLAVESMRRGGGTGYIGARAFGGPVYSYCERPQ